MPDHGKQDWAMCVGIGRYLAGSELVELPGAVNDAKAFYEWVKSDEGGNVPAGQHQLICSPSPLDQDDPKPVVADIKGFLRKIRTVANENFKSGQGLRVGRRPATEAT